MAGSPHETVHDTPPATNVDVSDGSIRGSMLGTASCAPRIPGCSRAPEVPRRPAARGRPARRVRPLRRRPRHDQRRSTSTMRPGCPASSPCWTADDLGVAPHHGFVKVHDDFARPPLADDRVRFVGEAIAVVFAETLEQGEDAAAAVWADIDPLPAVVDPEDRARRRCPAAVRRPRPNNVAVTSRPDAAARPRRRSPTSSCAGATSTSASPWRRWSRTAAPPRPDADGRLTFWASTPDAARARTASSPRALGARPGRRSTSSRPRSAAGSAARPDSTPSTRWSPPPRAATRATGRVGADAQRGHAGRCRTAAARCSTSSSAAAATARSPGCGCGSSATPAATRRSVRSCRAAHDACRTAPTTSAAIEFDVAVAATNTDPDGRLPRRRPARGDGAARAARRPGGARARHRPDRAAPDATCSPTTCSRSPRSPATPYDTGRYRLPLDAAAEAIGYDELRAEQRPGAERGDTHPARHRRRRPTSRSPPAAAPASSARSRSHADGSATVYCRHVRRTGRATRPRTRCSSATRPASRSIGSRSSTATPTGCAAAAARAGRVRCSSAGRPCTGRPRRWSTRPRQLAARLLEADVADIVVDTDQRHGRRRRRPAHGADVGRARRRTPSRRPTTAPLDGGARRSTRTAPRSRSAPTSPWSRSTPRPARSRLVRHVAVDDCGTVLNPLLVEGQQHGGIASGVGQALFEEIRFDADGNPITSNFADYGMPSAAEMPSFEVHSTETPTPLNPLGAKGIGEAATIGSTPADPERGDRRRRPPRRAPHRHAVHARAGVADDRTPPATARCPTRGASRRPCSLGRPRRRPRTRLNRRRGRHLGVARAREYLTPIRQGGTRNLRRVPWRHGTRRRDDPGRAAGHDVRGGRPRCLPRARAMRPSPS